MAQIDDAIHKIIEQRPWLSKILAIAFMILGYGKGRNWFIKKYGPV